MVPLCLSKGSQRTPGAAETAWPHITDPPLSPGSLSRVTATCQSRSMVWGEVEVEIHMIGIKGPAINDE